MTEDLDNIIKQLDEGVDWKAIRGPSINFFYSLEKKKREYKRENENLRYTNEKIISQLKAIIKDA